MTRTELLDRVQTVSKDLLGQSLPDGSLAETLDSMQLMTLVVGIEDEFRVAFEPEDETGIDTLADVLDLLERRLA